MTTQDIRNDIKSLFTPCTEAHPCHPDREAHAIAVYLADTGRLREGVTVAEVVEVIVRLRTNEKGD